MLVGLKRFSIICTSVLLSTPGNSVSTESTMPPALSPSPAIGVWVGYDIPRAVGCGSGWLYWFRALSAASWASNSAIRVSVGSACIC